MNQTLWRALGVAVAMATPAWAQFQVNHQVSGVSSPSVRYVQPWQAQNALPSETRMAIRASGALPSELRMNYRQLGPMAPAGTLSYIPERRPLVDPRPSQGNFVDTRAIGAVPSARPQSFTGEMSSPSIRFESRRPTGQIPGTFPIPQAPDSPGAASSPPWGGPSVTGNVRYAK